MRYEMMRPGQIQEAIRKRLPLLVPVGVIEYHGHQNPVGTDALICQGLAHEIERRIECVIAPTIFYGYTGEWAADEKLGEIHIGGDALYGFVKPILKAFFRQGWHRVYVICHHQGPQGVTQLSYQRAATESAMELAREESGAGWYRDHNKGLAPRWFATMRVVSDSEFAPGFGGHGGKDETSAMMYFYPESVDITELKRMKPMPYWAKDAPQASAEHGRAIAEKLVQSWVERLEKDRKVQR